MDGLNKYFYEVKPRDERPGRPAYQADNGYIGTELSLGATWGPWERLRLFGGVQLGYWKGSANEDSPLWREEFTVAVGGGLQGDAVPVGAHACRGRGRAGSAGRGRKSNGLFDRNISWSRDKSTTRRLAQRTGSRYRCQRTERP